MPDLMLPFGDPDGKNIVIYDLETKENPQIHGWQAYHKLGISVGCTYDYLTGDYDLYFDDNMEALAKRLNSADLVVGFNQLGFDNNLLRGSGYYLNPEDALSNYDILDESRRGLGWAPGLSYPKGCKLDNHLEAMFGAHLMKTGNGQMAFDLFAAKKWGPLCSYNIADVRRTKMVFERIWNTCHVSTVANGEVEVRHPSKFMKAAKAEYLVP